MSLARHQRVKRAFLGAAPAAGTVVKNIVCWLFLLEICFVRHFVTPFWFSVWYSVYHTLIFLSTGITNTSSIIFPFTFPFCLCYRHFRCFRKAHNFIQKTKRQKISPRPMSDGCGNIFCRFVVFWNLVFIQGEFFILLLPSACSFVHTKRLPALDKGLLSQWLLLKSVP